MGVAHGCVDESHSGTANALVLPQPAAVRVADGAMRDQQLMRCEGARIVLVNIGLGAKKRDLKAQRLAVLGGQPTGDVPPLGAKLRVAAIIRGKYQRLTGSDWCIGGRRGRRNHTPHAKANEETYRPSRA